MPQKADVLKTSGTRCRRVKPYLECTRCKMVKPRAEFSERQSHRVASAIRQCKVCCAERHAMDNIPGVPKPKEEKELGF